MASVQHMKDDRSAGCTLVIFFSFVCPSLLVLLYFSGRGFDGLPETGKLLACISVLLLLSAAYTGSFYGTLFLPLSTALLGAVSAAAVCVGAVGIMEKNVGGLCLLLVLVLAVPLQFLMSVSGMRTAFALHCMASEAVGIDKKSFRPQNIMMLVSWLTSACLAAYIFLR